MTPLLRFRSSLLRCARMMSDEINTLLLPYQLNYSLWQVMFVIHAKHGCTSIEIAEYLNVSKPSIAKRTHVLMEMNVLEQTETADKRQKKLVLSTEGEQLYAACAAEIDIFEHQLIQQFDASEIQSSIHIFNQLIHQIETANTGSSHE